MEVSPLSLGCAQIGNLHRPMDDAAAADVMATALGSGVTYFDTAPHYGLGLSEARLGALLPDPAAVVLSTKVGRMLERSDAPDPGDDLADGGFAVPARMRRRWDLTRDGVLRSLDESRKRLRRDFIDIAFIHDPDDHMATALDEAVAALVELRDAGAVGAIGAGMNWSSPLTRFVETGAVDVVLLAGRYTLCEQDALDDLLPAATTTGTSIVIGGVFNSGLLASADVADDALYNYAPAPDAVLAKARRLAACCREHGVTLPDAAMQFPLAHPAVASVLVGASSAMQMAEDAAHFDAPIPTALWQQLIEEGLLRADAPVPGG